MAAYAKANLQPQDSAVLLFRTFADAQEDSHFLDNPGIHRRFADNSIGMGFPSRNIISDEYIVDSSSGPLPVLFPGGAGC